MPDPMNHAGADEASSAIYIDFEGFKDQAPALIGILEDNTFTQVVLDDRLRSAAEAKDLRVDTGSNVLSELLSQAEDEQRRIAGFGLLELQAAKNWFDVDLEDRYLNGHRLGRRWWNRGLAPFVKKPEQFSLEAFELCLGIKRPSHLAPGNMTARLGAVLGQIEGRGSYDRITQVAKAKWTKLLDYNEFDVQSLATLVKRADHDIERADAQ